MGRRRLPDGRPLPVDASDESRLVGSVTDQSTITYPPSLRQRWYA